MSHGNNTSSSSSQAQVDAALQGDMNPLWGLAEAIHSGDASKLFTYLERCNAVDKFQLHMGTDLRGPSNKVARPVKKIYAILQYNMAGTNLHDAIFIVAASFNRVATVETMLAVDALSGVEWPISHERALDAACSNGHLEVASVIACDDDGQVSSSLNQSLALRYHCLAGDMEHAREILLSDSPDVTINAALLDACRTGRCDIVALLTADARFDQSVDGEKAFQLACVNGHVEVVSLLLRDFGVSLEVRGLRRALFLAGNAGHCDVVALLVQDPRVNPGLDKLFALKQYCIAGDVKRVKAALDDPDFVTTPVPGALLTAASRKGHAAIVELLLLDPRVDPSADDNDAILGASYKEHAGVIKLLLADPRVGPGANDNEAIREASSNGCVSIVKLLLADPRVDPGANDNDAIRMASTMGEVGVVKLLLADTRVDPAANDNEAIREASANGYGSVVELLLTDARVDPTADDNEAIREASANGCVNVVKLLLAHPKVDPTADNDFAIRIASSEGHSRVVKLLLADPRVDPEACDNYAIRRASRLGNENVVKLLLKDPRVDPSMGHPSALERASDKGHVSIVQLLLRHPQVVVTKATLVEADERHKGDTIRLLIEQQPRVLHDLFEDATPCIPDGALENELRQRQKASALTFLLALERCGGFFRVSDVLREVMVKYACFDLIENDVDDYSSAEGDESDAGWSSDDIGAEASDGY